MNKFEEMMKECIAQLGILCCTPVENSEDGVHKALEIAFNDAHTFSDGAKAVMIASRWMWAHCEKEYHNGASSATAK